MQRDVFGQLREQEPLLRPELSLSARARAVAWAAPLLLSLAVVARLPGRFPEGGHAHVFLAAELALALGALVLVGLSVWARLPVRRDRLLHVLVLLLALEAAACARAANPWLALRASGLLFAGAAFFLVGRGAAAALRGAPPLGAALFPLTLVVGGVLLEALGIAPGLSRPGHAPGGLVGERNAAAELLVCGAPLVALLATRGGRGLRAWALLVAALGAAALVLTRTRSAWLAAVALGGVGISWALRSRAPIVRRRAAALALAIALGAAAAPLLPTALRWSSPHPYRDTWVHLVDPASASGAGRLAQGRTTLRMALTHPLLGVGPGNWAGHYLAFAAPGDPTVQAGFWPVNRLPNSDLLGFLAERGVPAGVALALFAWLLLAPRDPHPGLRRATALAIAVVASLDAALQLPVHLGFAAWLFGACAPSSSAGSADAPEAPAPRPVLAVALAVLLASALLGAGRAAAFALATPPRRFEALERAVRLDPGDVPLRLILAEGWVEAGRCDRARPHLEAVARHVPVSPARAALAARCPAAPSR